MKVEELIKPMSDKIYIRNKAGKLTVELIRKLDLRDVTRGIGDDKLPPMPRPRLEFHKRRNGDKIVTLCNRDDELPGTMYVAFLSEWDTPEIWEGRYKEDEEDELIFETEE